MDRSGYTYFQELVIDLFIKNDLTTSWDLSFPQILDGIRRSGFNFVIPDNEEALLDINELVKDRILILYDDSYYYSGLYETEEKSDKNIVCPQPIKRIECKT